MRNPPSHPSPIARRIAGRVPSTVLGGLVVMAVAVSPFVFEPAPLSAIASAPPWVAPLVERLLDPGTTDAGVDDGVLPDGATVLDTEDAGVANLEPGLLAALQRASADAARDGVQLAITSGWRSNRYQAQLFRDAVATYGSEARAAAWVAPPGTSEHEAGAAVDIGPPGAAAWLSRHGAAYGLCQTYRNEPWHFELRPQAVEHGCPRATAHPRYASAPG